MMQVIGYTPFSEMTAEEHFLHAQIKTVQEKHAAELKPLFDRLHAIHAARSPRYVVTPQQVPPSVITTATPTDPDEIWGREEQ